MDIIMCGVGGQGTVLASRAIGDAAIRDGWQVRTSEIIGMAQREGSVVSQVRIHRQPVGPLIPDGSASVLLGFELAEAVRHIEKADPDASIIINTQTIVPPSVYLGVSQYNIETLRSYVQEYCRAPVFIDALEIARQAGSIKAVSAVMLGAFAAANQEIKTDLIMEELLNKLPVKLHDLNKQAFRLGKEYVEG
ncbi:MAG TPA: indolepyruvate oxidoreductase subunit beta [Syntrophomonadaceae bacterium]|nr:indolepyruvate oxidoreductase subunit beta [Syntrophomonadaceae bacterium]